MLAMQFIAHLHKKFMLHFWWLKPCFICMLTLDMLCYCWLKNLEFVNSGIIPLNIFWLFFCTPQKKHGTLSHHSTTQSQLKPQGYQSVLLGSGNNCKSVSSALVQIKWQQVDSRGNNSWWLQSFALFSSLLTNFPPSFGSPGWHIHTCLLKKVCCLEEIPGGVVFNTRS